MSDMQANLEQLKTLELKKDLFWVGSLDPDLRVFDVIMYSKYGTSYNSFILKGTKANVLVETVKVKFIDDYIQKLKATIDLNKINYLVVNHTEPDHAGSVEKLIDMIPNAIVIGSDNAIKYLKEITNREFPYKTVAHNEEISIGDKTLKFISAPFLHWPDSMYTYVKEIKTLFTCDSFGAHYSFKDILLSKLPEKENDDFNESLQYYWQCIFSPFKKYVLSALDKIKDLDFDLIGTGHGPVIDCRIPEILEKYREWSTDKSPYDKPLVVIAYSTAYGYTKSICESFAEGIKAKNPNILIKNYELDVSNYHQQKEELLKDAYFAKGIVIGTPTINNDALPTCWDFLINLNPIVHGGKIAFVTGSYGWNPSGIKNLQDRCHQLTWKTFTPFKVNFKPTQHDLDKAFNIGQEFAVAVQTGKINPDYLELPPSLSASLNEKKKPLTIEEWTKIYNPENKTLLWRCIVCDEILEGKMPPLECPVCSASFEMFEVYTSKQSINAKNEKKTFVIVGGGVAAVSAAEEIRNLNKDAEIHIISEENALPYYRPYVSDLLCNPALKNDKLFKIKPENWYSEKNIHLLTNKKATAIDFQAKQVVLNEQKLGYDKLILATGAKPFVPPFENVNLKNIYTCNNIEDVDKLKNIYEKGAVKNLVVVGGGILGLENAWAWYQIGNVNVSIIEIAPRILPLLIDEETSAFVEKHFENNFDRLKLYKNQKIKKFLGENDCVRAILLEDGTEILADLVIISAGVRSNLELFKNTALHTKNGIIVNKKMQTSINDVYAAGDCIEIENTFLKKIWSYAIIQAKVAAQNACGVDKEYELNDYAISLEAFGLKLFSVGYLTKIVSGVVYQQKTYSDNEFVKFAFHNHDLVWAVAINNNKFLLPMVNSLNAKSDKQKVYQDIVKLLK